MSMQLSNRAVCHRVLNFKSNVGSVFAVHELLHIEHKIIVGNGVQVVAVAVAVPTTEEHEPIIDHGHRMPKSWAWRHSTKSADK